MSAISELSHLKVEKPKTAEERRARRKEAGRDNKAGYLFLLPWLIGLVVITIGPLLASLYLSFTRYSLIQAPEWIGVENYVRMFSDPRWWKSLQVTFTYVIVGVPVQLVVALAIAIVLNEGMKGLAFYRSIFYLPSMLGASVAIAVLWRQMFGVDGLVNQVLRAVGIDSHIGWISDPQYALWSLILLHVWTFGSPMVIFLAGLRQIPGMYYEAASVDGATRWTKFRQDHVAVVVSDHLLQPGVAGDRRVPVVHPGVRGVGWHGWAVGLDAVLHAVSVPEGLRTVPDGICGGDGVAAGHHRRGHDRDQLLPLEVLGVL